MIQFTRTEIKWLIDIVENVIDTNNAYMESAGNDSLALIAKQINNLQSLNQRLKAIDEGITIRRIEITW